jgi:hypothetical protein
MRTGGDILSIAGWYRYSKLIKLACYDNRERVQVLGIQGRSELPGFSPSCERDCYYYLSTVSTENESPKKESWGIFMVATCRILIQARDLC